MFKEYIRNIVKEQIDDIRLENTLKQSQPKSYWEEHFKAQLKHTEALVKGRDKEIYKLKEENKELKNTLKGSKNTILELKESYSKEKLEKNKLLFNGYGERYEKDVLLKQISEQYEEIEKLKESIKNLGGTVSLKDNLLNEKNKEIEELKDLYEQEKNKNHKTLESEELSSKDFITNDIHIVQLEDVNSKIETIGNMVEKLVNENQDLKQEKEKLKIKVDEYYNKFLSEGIKKENAQQLIREVKKEIDLQGFDQDDFFSPEQTFYRIKNILKES